MRQPVNFNFFAIFGLCMIWKCLISHFYELGYGPLEFNFRKVLFTLFWQSKWVIIIIKDWKNTNSLFKQHSCCLKSEYVVLLGVNIDSKLSFNKHISSICSKLGQQTIISCKKFKHLIGDHIKQRLYMPLFYLLLITVVMFGTFGASVVKTNWNNSTSRL